MAKQLTTQQAKFCSYYIESGNGKASALKAGYSESTANNANLMLKKGAVKGRLEQHEKDLIASTSWNKTRIISELERIYQLSIQDNNLANAEKILNTIAKLINAMPNQSTTKQVNHNIKFERLLNELPAISNTYEAKVIN